MHRRHAWSWSAFLLASVLARAQEITLSSGEVLVGKVVSVTGGRAKLQLSDGSLRQVDVHAVVVERTAAGERRWHAARLGKAPIDAAARAQLDRMRQGQAVALPELATLVAECSEEMAKELTALLADRSPAVRAVAARALAMAATPETVHAALDAAKADRTGALWRELAAASTSGAWLGAVQALDARADLEAAITSKDKAVRFASAWAAVTLGSTAAQPVLAAFVDDSDHHARESAATCLAEAGNDAGAKVLLTIAKRERSPEVEANKDADAGTRDLLARGARRERLRAVALLGALQHAAAVPVLKGLAGGKDTELAAAAAKALAAIEGK
jgi:HEAT repeat protein